MRKPIVLLALASLAGAAQAQFISSFNLKTTGPDWLYQIFLPSSSARSGNGVGNCTFNPGTSLDPFKDGAYQCWFWYRGTGDGREYQPVNHIFETVSPTKVMVEFSEPVAGGGNVLNMQYTYELFAINANAAYVKVDWRVENKKAATQTVDFFVYQDLQVQTNTLSNTGSYDALTRTFSFNGDGAPMYFQSVNSDVFSYEMAPYTVLRGKLADNGQTLQLGNSVDAGPNDLAAAFQYRFTLTTGQVKTGSYLVGYGSLPLPEATVAGKVTLLDFVGDVDAQTVQLELRTPGTLDVVESLDLDLAADCGYSFKTMKRGNYDLAFRGKTWLREVVGNVNITDAGVSGLNASLINGDVDGDNSVTVFDYGFLSDAFDSSAGDPTWNPDADLDGDGSVTVFDYGILSDNFDKTGDD